MTEGWSLTALAAILDGLERELVEAPESEIAEVLQELGLRPGMAGSVALFELIDRCRSIRDEAAEESKEGPIRPLPFLRKFRRPN